MVGLPDVKREFNSLLNQVAVSSARERMGLQNDDTVMHLTFMGPPGTGKTTAAKILAKGYYAAGIVKKPKVVTLTPNELQAGYEGQTAEKVQKIFEEARGGVLFIDEAHDLGGGGREGYAKEALSQLLVFAEESRPSKDNPYGTVIILAGYGKESPNGSVLERLAKVNEGAARRFDRTVLFTPYTHKELGDIGERMIPKDYAVTPRAKKAFREGAAAAGSRENQNAGGVRKFVQEVKRAHNDRIGPDVEGISRERATTFTTADVNAAIKSMSLEVAAPKAKAVPKKKKAPAKKAVPVVEAAP